MHSVPSAIFIYRNYRFTRFGFIRVYIFEEGEFGFLILLLRAPVTVFRRHRYCEYGEA